MGTWKQAPLPLSKDSGANKKKQSRQHHQLEWRIAAALLDIAKNVSWHSGVTLTELRVTDRGDRWLVMVKGVRRNKPLVAYFSSGRFVDALVEAATTTDHGTPYWKDDDYPVKGSVKP